MVELVHSRKIRVHIDARANIKYSNIGWNARGAKHRNKKGGLVLAVAIVTFENLHGSLRLKAGLTEFDAGVRIS
jgi:hypothetical protein